MYIYIYVYIHAYIDIRKVAWPPRLCSLWFSQLFTPILLFLLLHYCCFTTALLLPYYCFTTDLGGLATAASEFHGGGHRRNKREVR